MGDERKSDERLNDGRWKQREDNRKKKGVSSGEGMKRREKEREIRGSELGGLGGTNDDSDKQSTKTLTNDLTYSHLLIQRTLRAPLLLPSLLGLTHPKQLRQKK